MMKKTQKRYLSGMRPTGDLHLGHYFGVLKNWLKLQEEGECFFFIADWHALTTEYASPQEIFHHSRTLLKEWLAVGIDPEKVVLFRQSDRPEHLELFAVLGMITPLPWLERVPSYKEMKANLKDRDLHTYGFLGYPLLQTADILLYRAEFVPVGEDQVAHLELAREIVRRFHHLYKCEIFPEPQPVLTQARRVPGTDGRKMSKSYGNAIFLSDPPEIVSQKVQKMITDPARVRRNDPGNPEVCDVFSLHKILTEPSRVSELDTLCRTAGIGCVECKKELARNINEFLQPIQERKKNYSDKDILTILKEGAEKAGKIAKDTLDKVFSIVGFR